MLLLNVLLLIVTLFGGTLSSRDRPPLTIIGGQNATIQAYPFIAALNLYSSQICGATIISSRWLLTAAHCTTNDKAYPVNPVRALTIRVGTDQLQSGGELFTILKIHDHPNYLNSTVVLDYDISLIYLEKDLVFDDNVKSIDLPESEDVFDGVATALGWGYTSTTEYTLPETLQKVDLPLIDNEKCQEMISNRIITDRMICAGYEAGGKDACNGDSGGPLIVDNKLVGVVSWGPGGTCAEEGLPGVYANVQSVRDWIREVMTTNI